MKKLVHRLERLSLCRNDRGVQGAVRAIRIAAPNGQARNGREPLTTRAERIAWLAQIGALLETLCAILEDLHLLECDEAATHHFVELREEFGDFGFGIDNLDDDRQIK